ncbi:hypothetical protein [Cellulosimicrobium sp. NPDC055967]|uniref:hypothetical protein n=1 Tax=Cellulosimicrobium sp. NPDC055967 TaxID=3345670 RepID=UPI0035DCF250
METLSTLLLVRFGLVVAAIVVAALVLFVVALVLRRRGRLDAAREQAAPVARAVARAAVDHLLGARGTAARDERPTDRHRP